MNLVRFRDKLLFMEKVHAKILTDESGKPVAVQITYTEWLEIEAALTGLECGGSSQETIESYRGTVSLTEDALAYQHRIRSEWS